MLIYIPKSYAKELYPGQVCLPPRAQCLGGQFMDHALCKSLKMHFLGKKQNVSLNEFSIMFNELSNTFVNNIVTLFIIFFYEFLKILL